MRVPNFYEPEIGSISFFAEIPEGATVQIVETNRDRIINSAKVSIAQALTNYPGKEPAAALFFSCATRRKILGTKAYQEYQEISSLLAERAMANSSNHTLLSCGFYTYGEIAPLEDYPITFLHQETLITLILGTR